MKKDDGEAFKKKKSKYINRNKFTIPEKDSVHWAQRMTGSQFTLATILLLYSLIKELYTNDFKCMIDTFIGNTHIHNSY